MNNTFAERFFPRRLKVIVFISLILFAGAGFAQDTYTKKEPLRRADSFFGIHFDFHANHDCREIGKNVTEESITEILRSVKPDFIQIDCKGHPGVSSYPTKVGNPAPGFVGDPLKLWRAVTDREHVALYMHYSGVFDQEAIKKDSTLARVNVDGSLNHDMTSVFGPYVDKVLIAQFKELNDVYHVDGAWVDGDCWAMGIDYSRKAIDAFQRSTGRVKYPQTSADQGYDELRDFSRKAYENYLKHYVDAIHAHNPKFQVASNWAYSSFMPEPVTANVDFLSGDYNYVGSVNSARWEGRYLQNQRKPWDLVSWGFVPKENGQTPKSEFQLEQEAAVIISFGGGFLAYFTQNRDGSVAPWKVKPMVGTGKFIRIRQPYCQHSTPIPQIALFYSRDEFYRRIPNLYGSWDTGDYVKGLLFAMLDGQQCVQVLSEHHLKGRMSTYPLIVIPDAGFLAADVKKEMLEYVKNGGKLLVTGRRSTKNFMDATQLHIGRDTIVAYGKGRIGFILSDLGARYYNNRSDSLRDSLNRCIAALFPNPIVDVKGSRLVDVTLNRTGKRMVVNLVNLTQGQNSGTVGVYNEIPHLTDIQVSVRTQKNPARITLIPENTRLNFTYNKGIASMIIPKIVIHSLVVIYKFPPKLTHLSR